MMKTFIKFIIKTLLFFIVLFILLLLSMCIKYEPENYYGIVEKVDSYPRNLIISTSGIYFNNKKFPKETVLKKIEVFFNNKFIDDIIVNKKLKDLKQIHEDGEEYQFKDDLLRILGKNNEKFRVELEGHRTTGFIFNIYIEEPNGNEVLIKKEVDIYFVKKGYSFFYLVE